MYSIVCYGKKLMLSDSSTLLPNKHGTNLPHREPRRSEKRLEDMDTVQNKCWSERDDHSYAVMCQLLFPTIN